MKHAFALLAGLLFLAVGTFTALAAPFAYVSNTASDDVWVVDIGSQAVVAVIPVGDDPRGIDASPDGARVFVANRFDNTVSVIDTASNMVIQTIDLNVMAVTATEPYDVVVSPDGARLYVAMKNGGSENGDGTVVFVDLPSGAIVTEVILDSDASPEGIVISPDGNTLYIGARDEMYIVDVPGQSFTGTAGFAERELVVSPDGDYVFANDNMIRTSDNMALPAGVSLGERGVAISPDGSLLFSTDQDTFVQVHSVDRSGPTPVLSFVTNIDDVGDPQYESYGIDLTADGSLGLVSYRDSNTVRVFSTASLDFVGPPIPMDFGIESGSEPKQLVIVQGHADPVLVYGCDITGMFKYSQVFDGPAPADESNSEPCLDGYGLSTKFKLKSFLVLEGACSVNILYGECTDYDGQRRKVYWFHAESYENNPDFCEIYPECNNVIDSVCDGIKISKPKKSRKGQPTVKGSSNVDYTWGKKFYRNIFNSYDSSCEATHDEVEVDLPDARSIRLLDIAGTLSKCSVRTTMPPTKAPFKYLNFCNDNYQSGKRSADICAPKQLCGPLFSYCANTSGWTSSEPNLYGIHITPDLYIECGGIDSIGVSGSPGVPGYDFASIDACVKYRLNTQMTACANLLEPVCNDGNYGFLDMPNSKTALGEMELCMLSPGSRGYAVLLTALYLESKGYEFDYYGVIAMIRKAMGLPVLPP